MYNIGQMDIQDLVSTRNLLQSFYSNPVRKVWINIFNIEINDRQTNN